MPSNPNPNCPKCKQADQVEKLADVYDANTQEWTEEELGMDVFGHVEDRQIEHEAHTRLGLKLKPPEEPKAPNSPGLWYGIGIAVVVILLAALCPFAVVPLAIAIPVLLANPATLPPVLRGQNGTTLAVGIGVAVLIGGLIGLALLVWLGFIVKHRFDRDMANYRAKKEDYEQNQLRPYQRAKERWDQSYFCKRDGVVFIPAENKAVPVEDLKKYLHDPYYQY